MEFSLYLMEDNKEHIEEVFIKDCGMVLKGNRHFEDIKIIVNSETVVYEMDVSFYYKLDINNTNVDWAKYWDKLFYTEDNFDKTISSAFGAILVSFENKNYVISLGRAYNYVIKLSNLDFGLNMAEICLTEDNIIIKSAKFFKKSKNKSLTQYSKSTYVTTEIGESDDFVIGSLILDEKYSKFMIYEHEDEFKFSASVKFNIRSYKPKDILKIVAEINYIYNNEKNNKKCSFPRLIIIKENEDNQPLISDLDKELLSELLNEDNVQTSLSYFEVGDGDVIITPNSHQRIEMIYDRNKYDIDYNIRNIKEKLKEIKCDDINKVSIRNIDTGLKKKLKSFIDYTTTYKDINYCLYNHKWAKFNQSYLDHVNREIINVNKITSIQNQYDLTDEILKEGEKIRKKEEPSSQIKYTEYLYNLYMKNKDDDKLLDRKTDHPLFKNVEFADIYKTDEKSLMHVKIGKIKDLRYCVEQSLRSAEIFSVHDNILNTYGIDSVDEVSLLFVTDLTGIFDDQGEVDFAKSRSLYFKVELIEWMNRIYSINLKPKIYIARDLREN